MLTITWQVEHPEPPAVKRYCKTCKRPTLFESSGLFRANAQKKHIDVWLIYRCSECSTTWNLAVLDRRNRCEIDTAMLRRLHENDGDLALRFALDGALIKRAGGEPMEPFFTIQGDAPPENTAVRIVMKSDCDSPIRLIALLREQCGLSRSQLARLAATEALICEDGTDVIKRRLGWSAAIIMRIPPDLRVRNDFASGL